MGAALPTDMTALLRTLASSRRLTEFAECHSIDETHFKNTARRFLQNVILTSNSSLYRGLVLDEDADPKLCLRHKRLLQNIFHPDKSDEPGGELVLLHVQSTFKLIQQPLNNMHNETPMYSGPTIKTHKPHSNYRNHKRSESINITLAAGLFGMGFLAILIYFVVPSSPQDNIIRQANSQAINPTAQALPVIPVRANANLQLSRRIIEPQSFQGLQPGQHAFLATPESVKVRELLQNLELALEGERSVTILSNNNRPAASIQLTRMFDSSVNRKVFLHDIAWKRISDDTISGKGKFLTRFDFGASAPQVLRSGDFQIDVVTDSQAQPRIGQFFLEDNLH